MLFELISARYGAALAPCSRSRHHQARQIPPADPFGLPRNVLLRRGLCHKFTGRQSRSFESGCGIRSLGYPARVHLVAVIERGNRFANEL
jgi:hypothetical protein